MSPREIEAEPARRVEPDRGPDQAGEDTGLVEVKTRLPIHLHLQLAGLAEDNHRSMAAELRLACVEHVANAYRGQR